MHGFGEGKTDLKRWRLAEEEEWSAGGGNEGESQRLTTPLSVLLKGRLFRPFIGLRCSADLCPPHLSIGTFSAASRKLLLL